MSNDNRLDCAIVSDLLPLYHDGVVSDITSDAVKKHIEDCDACSAEYEKLSVELPTGENDVSTKSKFSKMMRKAKMKRVITTTLVVILTCTLLISAFCVLTQIPLVNIDETEIEVSRVYRYEVDGVKKFFVLYSKQNYGGISFGNLAVTGEGDTYTLEANVRRTVLYQKLDDPILSEEIWIFDATSWEDFEVLKFGEKVIWTEDENADDIVPDYVYAYDAFENNDRINGWVCSVEYGYLGADYVDGRFVAWDLDGNVIYDEYPDENGEYPEFLF